MLHASGVSVGVTDGDAVTVTVGDGDAVEVGVTLTEGVGDRDAVGDAVREGVGDSVGDGVVVVQAGVDETHAQRLFALTETTHFEAWPDFERDLPRAHALLDSLVELGLVRADGNIHRLTRAGRFWAYNIAGLLARSTRPTPPGNGKKVSGLGCEGS